jgi:hypothetical protein
MEEEGYRCNEIKPCNFSKDKMHTSKNGMNEGTFQFLLGVDGNPPRPS